MRRALRLLAGLALALCLGGCAGVSTGPVEPPEIYPDRTSAGLALQTWLWAWHKGDVAVLRQVTGWLLHARLEKELKANPPEKVAEFYRQDTVGLRVEDIDWTELEDQIAYVRLTLRSETIRHEADVSLVRRPDGWVVTAHRKIR
ncbi:MAG TPA: hypothetical protein DEA08_20785 [Planctomycetes bacterium]|nr:hypothetical protein [Planctomycetota bacterium]